MKRFATYGPLVVAAAALLSSSGCGGSTAAKSSPAAPEPPAASVQRVRAATPERKTLELYTSQPGRIEAFETTPLYPKVSGYVHSINVDIGDTVQKDQTLISLSIPEMQDLLEQKRALVAQAAAEVKQTDAAMKVAQAAVQSAQARVSQAEAGTVRAEAEFNRWNAEYERIRELAARGSVNQKLVDETLNQLRAAEASRQEVAAQIDSAQAEQSEAQAKALLAEADREAALAKQQVAEADLRHTATLNEYADIKTPFDGVVTRRGVHTGHYVHPAGGAAAEPLLVVARTDKLRVVVDVPELESGLVDAGENGDRVTIRCQAQQAGECVARVSRTSWSLTAENRSLRTEIDILAADGSALRPGMFATATILLDKREDVLVLPIGAIVQDAGQTYCWVVETGKLDRRQIQLGLRSGKEVEVLSGLDGSEQVVLTGANMLQQGQPVEVIL